MSQKKKFKFIVAFTFNHDTNNIRDNFVDYIKDKEGYNAEFQDESTYGILQGVEETLINDIRQFCLNQLKGKTFNYSSEDFIKIYCAENNMVYRNVLKPRNIQDEEAVNNIEYQARIREIKAKM